MLSSIILTVTAQTLWKIGGSSADLEYGGIVGLVLAYIKSPLVIAGFFLSSVAALLWTYSLTKLDFNYVSFVGSFSYVLVIIISLLVFKETISPARWLGCATILIGIFIVLRS